LKELEQTVDVAIPEKHDTATIVSQGLKFEDLNPD
jgi:hypothetical protein